MAAPKTSGNLFEAGVRFLVRGARESLRSTNTMMSAQKSLTSSYAQTVTILAKQSREYKNAASAMQQFQAQAVKEKANLDVGGIKAAQNQRMITDQQAIAAIAATKVAAKHRVELELGTDATGALASAEQKLVIATQVANAAKQRFAISLALVSATISGLTNTLNTYLAKLVQVTSASQAQQRSTLIVGASYGISQEAIEKEIVSMGKLLFTRTQSSAMLTKVIAAEMDAATATKLAAVANDVATAQNKEAIEVLGAFADALVNVSAESLRTAGIGGNATEIYGRYATSIGKVTSALTDYDKRQAILAHTLSTGARYQGAFAAAMESAGNQSRTLKQELDTLSNTVGNALAPSVVELTKLLTGAVAGMNALPEPTKDVIVSFVGSASALVGIGSAAALALPLIKALGTVLSGLLIKAGVVGAAGTLIASPWILGIGAVLLLLGTLTAALLKFRQDARDTAQVIEQSVGQKIANQIVEQQRAFDSAVLTRIADAEKLVDGYSRAMRTLRDVSRMFESDLDRIADGFFTLKVAASNLDRALWPIEDALTRITAATTLTLIPLNRAERLLSREIADLQKIVDLETERKRITDAQEKARKKTAEALEKAQKTEAAALEAARKREADALDKIRKREAANAEKARIKEAADALKARKKEAADAEKARKKAVADAEKARRKEAADAEKARKDEAVKLAKARKEEAEYRISLIGDEIDRLKELLQLERDRLESTQHDVFMEELRNRILKKTTSGRLLELKGEEALREDLLAVKQQEIEQLQEQYEQEKAIAEAAARAETQALEAAAELAEARAAEEEALAAKEQALEEIAALEEAMAAEREFALEEAALLAEERALAQAALEEEIADLARDRAEAEADARATRAEADAATRKEALEIEETFLTVAGQQLKAAEERQALLQRDIELEEDKRTFQQEELELARARQVEGRLYITEQTRSLEEQQMWRQRDVEMVSRQNEALQIQADIQRAIVTDLEDIQKNRLASAAIDAFPELKAMLLETERLIKLAEDLETARLEIEKARTIANASELAASAAAEKASKARKALTDAILEDAWKQMTYLDKMVFWYQYNMKSLMGLLEKVKQMSLGQKIVDWVNKTLKAAASIGQSFVDWLEQNRISSTTPSGSKSQSTIQKNTAAVAALASSFSSLVLPSILNTGYNQTPSPTVWNTTYQAPSLAITANYAQSQSVASITDDMRLMLQLV